MFIGKNMQKALASQVAKEFKSAYMYLGMASYFEEENLAGFAHWMKQQAQEELSHAMKIFNHVHQRGGKVALEALPKVSTTYKSPLEAFKVVLKHEQFITDSINKLHDIAVKEKDKATEIMLQWFITEQIEEEEQSAAIVDRLKKVKGIPGALYIFDAELKTRE